jgi:hypothetical protein
MTSGRRLVAAKTRLIAALIVLAVAANFGPANAEVHKGEIMFGPFGLFSVPTDDYPSPLLDDVPYIDFGADVEPSPGLSVAADRMITPKLSLGGEFKVYFGTVNEQRMQDFLDFHVPALDEAEVTWRTVHLGARARYFMQPEKRFNPFLHAGVGFYLSKLLAEFRQNRGSGSTNDFSRSESFTNPGVSIGPGALVRISKDTRVSIDAIFTNVFTAERNVRYVGLSLGLLFSVTPQ